MAGIGKSNGKNWKNAINEADITNYELVQEGFINENGFWEKNESENTSKVEKYFNKNIEGNEIIYRIAPASYLGLLSATGQTVVIATGDDGDRQEGVEFVYPRFVVHGDNTFTDTQTGLMWYDNYLSSSNWQNALDAVGALSVGGHADWRMPNVYELQSLHDRSFDHTTNFMDSDVIELVTAWGESLYSSTTTRDTSRCYGVTPASAAWTPGTLLLKSSAGHTYAVRGESKGRIWLPKTGQVTSYHGGDDGDLQLGRSWPVPRFVDNGDSTVTDLLYGIMWPDGQTLSSGFSAAIAACNSFVFAGYSDWYMPNIRELFSLFDLFSANATPPVFSDFTASVNIYSSTYSHLSPTFYDYQVGVVREDNGVVAQPRLHNQTNGYLPCRKV